MEYTVIRGAKGKLRLQHFFSAIWHFRISRTVFHSRRLSGYHSKDLRLSGQTRLQGAILSVYIN